jgi:hypothetical protein
MRMSPKSLADAARIRGGRVHLKDCSDAKLLLEEVRASGVPAYFFDHGERLLFLDGEIYDLREVGTAARAGTNPTPLPHAILENGVGLEYGWRHIADCACPHCRSEASGLSRRGAVA